MNSNEVLVLSKMCAVDLRSETLSAHIYVGKRTTVNVKRDVRRV